MSEALQHCQLQNVAHLLLSKALLIVWKVVRFCKYESLKTKAPKPQEQPVPTYLEKYDFGKALFSCEIYSSKIIKQVYA